jgi:hypothetical protein
MTTETPAVKCLIIEDGYDLLAVPLTDQILGLLPELLEIRKIDRNSDNGHKFLAPGRIKFYISEVQS